LASSLRSTRCRRSLSSMHSFSKEEPGISPGWKGIWENCLFGMGKGEMRNFDDFYPAFMFIYAGQFPLVEKKSVTAAILAIPILLPRCCTRIRAGDTSPNDHPVDEGHDPRFCVLTRPCLVHARYHAWGFEHLGV
jgi:hypothetical protein